MQLTELQEQWLQLLESGKYEQGRSKLCRDDKYCCLGIAAEHVLKIPYILEQGIKQFIDQDNIGLRLGGTLSNVAVLQLKLRGAVGNIKSEYEDSFYNALLQFGYDDSKPTFSSTNDTLASYNDNGATFKQLAAAIRACPEAVFTNPTE